MAGTRGGVGRFVAMAIAMAVVLSLVLAETARAGTYEVAQCGWGVGADLAGIDASGPGFVLGSGGCGPLAGLGQDMKLEAQADGSGAQGWIGARWAAPPGNTFVAARAVWAGDLQSGFGQILASRVDGNLLRMAFAGLSTSLISVGGDLPPRAGIFEVQLSCGGVCVRSAPSSTLLGQLTLTVLDPNPPTARLEGGLLDPVWLRGTTQLTVRGEDSGAGLALVEATVDGAGIIDAPQACATITIEGRLRGTRMEPCPPAASRNAEVDTSRIPDGTHTLRGCATDFGGETGCAPDVQIKVDNSAPAIAFTSAAEGAVAVRLSDPWSGPAAGSIAMQREGEAGWTRLQTRLEPGAAGSAKLTADLPTIADGSYVFKATASDAVGNSGVAQLAVSGTAEEVRRQIAGGKPSPTGRTAGRSRDGGGDRKATRLDLALVGGGGSGGRRSRRSLTVPYGASVEVRGRLAGPDGGEAAGETVTVLAMAARGADPRRRARRTVTDGAGRFSLRLPAGPSRRIVATFGGDPELLPARSRAVALRVGAAVSLTAEPHSLATGESVSLGGRVSPGPARIPRRGKVVTIQYLERASGRWRPALVARTDRRGRFHVRYRFRYVTGEARIRLRATVLPEAGWPYAEGSSEPVTVRVHG